MATILNHSPGNPPLNGQERRRECLDEIVRRYLPSEIVETGTFLGSSTRLFARRYRVPAYSIENNPFFFAYAGLRLLRDFRAHVRFGRSLPFLAWRAKAGARGGRVLFYLDAHFYDDHPLRGEVRFILDRWRDAVIVIDDFAVDDDPGYSYERDGARPLSLSYLELPASPQVDAYFPARRSDEETGKRTGALVLGAGPYARPALLACMPQFLRPVPAAEKDPLRVQSA